MKRIYALFSLLLLLLAGVLPAAAQYKQGDDPLTEITDGQNVLLQNGRAFDAGTSYAKYMAEQGTAATDYFSDKVEDATVMQFVSDGEGKYLLYNPAAGAYVESPDYRFLSGYATWWTENKDEAAHFEAIETTASDEATPAFVLKTQVTAFSMDAYYAPLASYSRGAGYSFNLIAGREYYNSWVVYPAESLGAKTAGTDPLDAITSGQEVLFQNGRAFDAGTSYAKYMAEQGTAATDYFSDKVDETTILQLVSDGEGKYLIYNPAAGAYVESPDYRFLSGYATWWTTNPDEAAHFEAIETTASDQATPAFVFKTQVTAFSMDAYYAPLASYSRGAGYNFNLISGYEYYNSWVLYPVEIAGGREALELVFYGYFPNGLTDEAWLVGEGPGTITQELFDALKAAFTAAEAAVEDPTVGETACARLADQLKAAYQAAAEGVVPMTEGYYYIRNLAVDGLVYAADSQNDNGDIVTTARWQSRDLPETYTSADAPYIWKVEKQEDGTGFLFYHPVSDKYLSRSGSYGAATPLLASSSQNGVFAINYQPDNYISVGGYFNVLNTYFGGRILRAIGNDNGVGYNSSSTDPKDEDAQWQFIPVSEADVAAMLADKERDALNEQLAALVDKSLSLLAATKSYTTTMRTTGTLDTPGLVTALTTNAQEPTEGDAFYAIDSEGTTFFHSVWSDSEAAPDYYHHVMAELSDEVQDVAIKLVKRVNVDDEGNVSTNGHNPATFVLYAGNNPDIATLDSVGTFKAIYDKGFAFFEGTDETALNTVSVTYTTLPAPARYLCLVVTSTESNAKINGFPYFNIAEIGVYKAVYDPETSAYENIPEAVRNEFLAQLAAAEAEVDAAAATRETLDALAAAYEAMDDAFADRSKLRALLDDARSYQLEAIEDDAELGYYQYGSTDVFAAALDAIEERIDALVNPTTEDCESVEADIAKALADFDAQLNKPDGTALYYIQSASAIGDNYDRYLYTATNDESYASLNNNDVSDAGAYLIYQWRVEPQADGTFYLRNASNGLYLGGVEDETQRVTSTYEPVALRIVSARTVGALTIQTLEGKNLFAQDYQQGIVLSDEGKGPDGAAFQFLEADFQSSHITRANAGLQVVTLPFDIVGTVIGGTAYRPLGRKATDDGTPAARFAAYGAEEVIPAATPFLLVGDEGINEVTYYTAESDNGTAIEYVLTPGTATGLVGTLRSTTVLPPYCVIRNGKIDAAVNIGNVINANSGYFDLTTLADTDEEGDLALPLADAVSALRNLGFDLGTDTSLPAYDLQGRRVAQPQAGGVYIIGGRKVLVK